MLVRFDRTTGESPAVLTREFYDEQAAELVEYQRDRGGQHEQLMSDVSPQGREIGRDRHGRHPIGAHLPIFTTPLCQRSLRPAIFCSVVPGDERSKGGGVMTRQGITGLGSVRCVMAFVADPERAATWWAAQLGCSPQHDQGFWWVDVDGTELGFHPADDAKNPHGASTVAYWSVDHLDTARSSFIAAGCIPVRGPLDVTADRRICQLTDPFGVVFGIDGP
jgi:hypothetical protein